MSNAVNFRSLAIGEILKGFRRVIVGQSRKMVNTLDNHFKKLPSGIRAQLFDKEKGRLVMDFLIEHGENSTHILNAVSPGFTCSFAFAERVVDEMAENF